MKPILFYCSIKKTRLIAQSVEWVCALIVTRYSADTLPFLWSKEVLFLAWQGWFGVDYCTFTLWIPVRNIPTIQLLLSPCQAKNKNPLYARVRL